MTAVAEKPLTGAEEIYWDLSDLYASPDDPRIEADMQEVDRRAQAFEKKYRGKVASLDVEGLLEAMQELEVIYTTLSKLGSYAGINWTTDTQNPVLGKLLARTQEHATKINQVILFFELEWINAPEETAKLAGHPSLSRYGHYLTVQRAQQPYTRSEPEEKIMSQLALTGSAGWSRYFGELVSNLRFPWEGREVTQAEILAKLYAPDREVRRKAADVVTEVLQANKHATTYIFNMILLDKSSRDEIRGYPSWISSRNLSNQVDDATVEALIGAVTSRYDIVARYYRMLKKLLKVDELYDYDRYAPFETEQMTVRWEQGKDWVLTAFAGFHPRMADIASEFFDKRWIDAAIRMGKRGGAYSASTAHTVHPYIFMNFEGNTRSVETLAHELGHGIHQYLSRVQGEFQADTPLTTAEMASTFCEMIVFDHLVAQAKSPSVRLGMRMEKIASTFATVFRQIAMNRFEHAIHTARRQEGELSTEQLSGFWMETQQSMFLDSVTMRDEYSIWWSYIPHFLSTPGYVYAYAFGELLVWALYARYKSGMAGFQEKYLEVLTAGGSDYPHNILAPMGIDLRDPAFWQEGLGLLDEFVAQTEADAEALG
jgi:oligoendopeptidase F